MEWIFLFCQLRNLKFWLPYKLINISLLTNYPQSWEYNTKGTPFLLSSSRSSALQDLYSEWGCSPCPRDHNGSASTFYQVNQFILPLMILTLSQRKCAVNGSCLTKRNEVFEIRHPVPAKFRVFPHPSGITHADKTYLGETQLSTSPTVAWLELGYDDVNCCQYLPAPKELFIMLLQNSLMNDFLEWGETAKRGLPITFHFLNMFWRPKLSKFRINFEPCPRSLFLLTCSLQRHILTPSFSPYFSFLIQ